MKEIIFIIFFISANVFSQQKGTLIIKFEELPYEQGILYIALYNNEQEFLIHEYKGAILQINNSNAVAEFNNLPFGDYAVSCFYDKNKNGLLDKNFLGIPKEPYAFSNNATGSFGPPKFEKAKISLRIEEVSISIKL